MAATVASRMPESAPRQPAWAAPMTRALAIAKEDRSAIGGEHADGKAGRGGDDGIGLGRALHSQGLSATTAFALWI